MLILLQPNINTIIGLVRPFYFLFSSIDFVSNLFLSRIVWFLLLKKENSDGTNIDPRIINSKSKSLLH